MRLNVLDSDRLLLRPQRVSDAAVFRQLWLERDTCVPPHRRIDPNGHPSVSDIARQIGQEAGSEKPGLLTVERKATADVIGYCGLVFTDTGAPGEPELAFELLGAVHNCGYATEAGEAVISWARDAGYQRVWASVWNWNVASLRVLAKLGFRDTGEVIRVNEHGSSLLIMKSLADRGEDSSLG